MSASASLRVLCQTFLHAGTKGSPFSASILVCLAKDRELRDPGNDPRWRAHDHESGAACFGWSALTVVDEQVIFAVAAIDHGGSSVGCRLQFNLVAKCTRRDSLTRIDADVAPYQPDCIHCRIWDESACQHGCFVPRIRLPPSAQIVVHEENFARREPATTIKQGQFVSIMPGHQWLSHFKDGLAHHVYVANAWLLLRCVSEREACHKCAGYEYAQWH